MSGFLLLLSHGNVKAVQRNHPDEFVGALRAVEELTTRTGLPYTTDEQRRLAALTVLQSKGLFAETSESLRAQFPTTTTKAKRKRKAKTKEALPA